MIFPFLLSGVFILKFYYLLWQVFFFLLGNETTRMSFWLLALSTPHPTPAAPFPFPLSSVLLAQVLARSPLRFPSRTSGEWRARSKWKQLQSKHLHFETPAYRGKKIPFDGISYLKGKYPPVGRSESFAFSFLWFRRQFQMLNSGWWAFFARAPTSRA